jgi:hypothetical protein
MTKVPRGLNSALHIAGAAAVAALLLMALPVAASADQAIGAPGSGAGQYEGPSGLAVDASDGQIYVADQTNNRIDVFTEDGEFVRAFGWGVATGAASLQVCTTASTCRAGVAGAGAGQFNQLTQVAVDNDPASPSFHDVFAADSGNHRIERFTPSGEFVLAFGSGVDQTTHGNVCTAVSGHVCGAGTPGFGAGQFNEPIKLAIGAGAVYVADEHRVTEFSNTHEQRVQEFEPSGSLVSQPFSTTVEGGLNGVAADANGDFYLATGGAANAVQKYGPSGTLLATFNPSLNIRGLAVDYSSGDVFVSDSPGVDGRGAINVYDSSGDQLSVIYGEADLRRTALAARHNAAGDVYAISSGESGIPEIIDVPFPPPGPVVYPNAAFTNASPVSNTTATLNAIVDPEGKAASYRFEYVDQAHFESGGFSNPATESSVEEPIAAGFGARKVASQINVAPETTYHFRVVATSSDGVAVGPEVIVTTLRPFEIEGTWSSLVGTDDATLSADIDPLGIQTTAYFQYVDDATFRATGFAEAVDIPNVIGGASPIDLGSGEGRTLASVVLSSLTPGVTYHYRVVAEDSFGSQDGPTHKFNTFSLPGNLNTSCPNQAFRIGASARLADCRAYELVSPIDKNGGNVAGAAEREKYGTLAEASSEGDRATFSSTRSFGMPSSAPLVNQYLSTRGPDGWSTRSISPPRASFLRGGAVNAVGRFHAFSEDLCSAWFYQDSSLRLVPTAPAGYANLYRGENCGEPGYELLNPTIPTGVEPEAELDGNLLVAQGFSADLTHTVFRSLAGLTKESCTTGLSELHWQLYESYEGGEKLRLVSALPNGKASCLNASVGSKAFTNDLSAVNAWSRHAVSASGKTVYWTGTEGPEGNTQQALYVRINASEPQSKVVAGKCTEAEKACTLAVSDEGEVHYWEADREGSKALYTVGSLSGGAELSEYDLATGSSQPIAGGVEGVVGASEDLSRIYFLSSQVLSGAQVNNEGQKAQSGAPNLYLDEGGAITYIATLNANESSFSGGAPVATTIDGAPGNRSSRVSGDGLHLAFTSGAQLSEYDNTVTGSGEPAEEVYLYDAVPGGPGDLHCVSCNPSGERPSARKIAAQNGLAASYQAADLPVWSESLRASRVLSASGNRLFFESVDPLVLADTNGKKDVYEWERSSGSQACTEAGAELYAPSADGCLSLISSGTSPEDSELTDASAEGEDVFFITGSSLLPGDPGLVDMYDARIGGGFAEPVATGACEGEACQGPIAPPNDPTPGSATFSGPGNVKETSTGKKQKKKHRKKDKARHTKKQIKRSGRAGR